MYLLNDSTGITNPFLHKEIVRQVKRKRRGFKKFFKNKITLEEVASLEEISLVGVDEIDFSFLKYFKNLETLDMTNCNFKSTYGVQQATKLKNFCAFDTHIEDLGYIRDCYGLEMFDYMVDSRPECKKSNFDCVTSLGYVWEIDLSGNNVEDVTFLAQLKSLKELVLAQNPIKNIEMLQDLPNLTYLEVEECGITSFEWAREFKFLENLYAQNNPLSEVDKTRYEETFKYIDKVQF